MRIDLEMPTGFEAEVRNVVMSTVKDAFAEVTNYPQTKEWMSLKEGADYVGVSFNTFKKFREMGLKVCEIDGVKRVSKAEIDNFLKNNSH